MKIKKLLLTTLLFAGAFGQGLWAQNDHILTEGFEDGLEVNGWETVVGEGALVGITEDAAYEGSHSFHLEMGEEDSYLISPLLVGTDNGLKVSFRYNNYYDNTPSRFMVGYSTTSNSTDDFEWSDPIHATECEWMPYESEFPAGTKYVAIRYLWEDNYHVFLDDFVFDAVACAVPTKPVLAGSANAYAVSLNWTGVSNSYKLKYTTSDHYGFEDGEEGWTSFNSNGDVDVWYQYDGNFYSGDYCIASDVSESYDNYLVSPVMALEGSISFYAKAEGSWKGSKSEDATADGQFKVLVTTVEPPFAESDFTEVSVKTAITDAWMQVVVDLDQYAGQIGYVVIKHLYWEDDWAENPTLLIDDIRVITSESVTIDVAGDAEMPYTLDNLWPETDYAIYLQGICDEGQSSWTEPLYVTTDASENTICTFVGNGGEEGEWNNVNYWDNGTLPGLEDDVIIDADVVIPSGCVAKAGHIKVNLGKAMTIQEGGELQHGSFVKAVVQKAIQAYESDKDNYYLIASPMNEALEPGEENGFLTNDYDLYYFDQTGDSEGKEWINRESGAFKLQNTKGYLYANEQGTTLSFSGQLVPSNAPVIIPLDYDGSAVFAGWNLVGNPFACTATVSGADNFYKISGTELEPASGEVAPCEGIFVMATEANQNVTFGRKTMAKAEGGSLNISVVRNGGRVDNARVRFCQGRGLEKFQLNPNHTKVYFLQEGKEYAVVHTDNTTDELPVSFKAEEAGNYTITVANDDIDFSYLHLIDNKTGVEVDLLKNPSYSFEALNTDYDSRFRLVFATGSSVNGENFGFVNTSGNFVIYGIDGQATLQVVDVMGRLVSSETINGNAEISLNQPAGIYMLRLVNGSDVKVQKVVVR